MSSTITLDPRLASAAAFVRGGRLADVGTDHGYLPIYLLIHGKIDFAAASDVRPGPLESARTHCAELGVLDRVELVLTDGLCGIDKFAPDDIAILGMGGELIASIIDRADWVRDGHIRLILQPMTKRDLLRSYLLSHGFTICDESVSESDGRIYQTICAEYTGVAEEFSVAELLLGRVNIARRDPLTVRYAENLLTVYERRLEGKSRSTSDTSDEVRIINELRAVLSDMERK